MEGGGEEEKHWHHFGGSSWERDTAREQETKRRGEKTERRRTRTKEGSKVTVLSTRQLRGGRNEQTRLDRIGSSATCPVSPFCLVLSCLATTGEIREIADGRCLCCVPSLSFSLLSHSSFFLTTPPFIPSFPHSLIPSSSYFLIPPSLHSCSSLLAFPFLTHTLSLTPSLLLTLRRLVAELQITQR